MTRYYDPDYEAEVVHQRERNRAWKRSGLTVEEFEAAEARTYEDNDQ